MLYPLNTFVPTTLRVISSIAPFRFFLSEREARDEETKANRETTFYFLIITKKYSCHSHHHHYFMYYTFESHFLHQLYLSLKCQHGKKPFIFKYCQVTFNFFYHYNKFNSFTPVFRSIIFLRWITFWHFLVISYFLIWNWNFIVFFFT